VIRSVKTLPTLKAEAVTPFCADSAGVDAKPGGMNADS
jgi:hypothetical protein